MPKKTKDFTCEVIQVLNEKQVNEKNKVVLGVVKWSNAPHPVIENRRFYYHDISGEWRPMKTTGIGIEELKIILESQETLLKILSE